METEAYAGDEASHFVTRSPSAGPLLGTTHGLTYVYVIYGMHLCLNVTADATGPGAVLLRALQPTQGLDVMRARRSSQAGIADVDLCRGPGRLAQAMGATKDMTGRPFLELFDVEPPAEPIEVVTAPRVGITRAMQLPWRFAVPGNRHVSSPRPR